MRKTATLLAAALGLAFSPAGAAAKATPEAQLAKALEGRVAGEPVNCIPLNRIRSSRIIDKTAILYEAGNIVYLNRPRSGAESLDSWDVLVTKLHSSQLCSIDVVNLYDSNSRMTTGFVFLDEFVPYRRVKAASRD